MTDMVHEPVTPLRAAAAAAWPAAAVIAVQLVAFPVPFGVTPPGRGPRPAERHGRAGPGPRLPGQPGDQLRAGVDGHVPGGPGRRRGAVRRPQHGWSTGGLALVGGRGRVCSAPRACVRLDADGAPRRRPWSWRPSARAGLQVADDLGWVGGLAVGVTVAVLSGIGIDAIVIRRLRTSPRLVVTVATIGLAQLFAVIGLLAPRLWGAVALVDPDGDRTGSRCPATSSVTIGSTVFGTRRARGGRRLARLHRPVSAVGAAPHRHRHRRAGRGRQRRPGLDARRAGARASRRASGSWPRCWPSSPPTSRPGSSASSSTAGVGLRVMVARAGRRWPSAGSRRMPSMLMAAVAIGVLTQAHRSRHGGHSLTLDRRRAGRRGDRRPARAAGVDTARADRDTTSSWQVAAEPRGLPVRAGRGPRSRRRCGWSASPPSSSGPPPCRWCWARATCCGPRRGRPRRHHAVGRGPHRLDRARSRSARWRSPPPAPRWRRSPRAEWRVGPHACARARRRPRRRWWRVLVGSAVAALAGHLPGGHHARVLPGRDELPAQPHRGDVDPHRGRGPPPAARRVRPASSRTPMYEVALMVAVALPRRGRRHPAHPGRAGAAGRARQRPGAQAYGIRRRRRPAVRVRPLGLPRRGRRRAAVYVSEGYEVGTVRRRPRA